MIKNRIIKNLKNIENDELKSIIKFSILDNNDLSLPGLGVLFEILWEYSDENSQEYIINTIINKLN